MRVRGGWRPNRTAIFWPLLFWPSALCLSRSPGLLNRRLGGLLCWLSLLHLITNWSGPQTPSGFPSPFRLVWLSAPHLVSNSVRSLTVWLLVLTELYNSSTPTQSLTQSLEWHVWSSSRGNNCHAVQRSLSSGASVYESIMGFLPCPILLAKSAHAISFDYWPLECVTSFRCITLEGSKYNRCSRWILSPKPIGQNRLWVDLIIIKIRKRKDKDRLIYY